MEKIKKPRAKKEVKGELVIPEDYVLIDEDLLSAPIKEPSVEKPKNKVLLGYHPITGAEVWSK